MTTLSDGFLLTASASGSDASLLYEMVPYFTCRRCYLGLPICALYLHFSFVATLSDGVALVLTAVRIVEWCTCSARGFSPPPACQRVPSLASVALDFVFCLFFRVPGSCWGGAAAFPLCRPLRWSPGRKSTFCFRHLCNRVCICA